MATTTIELGLGIDLKAFNSAITKVDKDLSKIFNYNKKIVIGADVDDVGDAFEKVAKEFDDITRESSKLQNDMKKTLAVLQATGKGGTKEFDELSQKLKDTRIEAKKLEDAFDKIDDIDIDVEKNNKLSGGMLAVGAGLAATAIAGVATALTAVAGEYNQLDVATRSMTTLGDEAEALAPKLKEVSITLSQELPFAAGELQNAFTNAIASGIKGGEKELSKFVETAAKLAVGGGTGIDEATAGLAATLNAFGASANDAEKYADIFFNTVNYGVVSVDELNQYLSQVTPTAAAAGISFENVGAAVALLTQKGVPASQAMTKLNAMLIEVQKPSPGLRKAMKAAGLSVEELQKVMKDEGLPAALDLLQKAFEKTGVSATQAFGSSEAASAFNVLQGQAGEFKTFLDDVSNTAGSAENAFNKMSGSFENQMKIMKNAITSSLFPAIESLLPLVTDLIKELGSILAPVIKGLADSITPLLKTVVPEISKVLMPIVGIINQINTPLMHLINTLLKSLLPPIVRVLGQIMKALEPFVSVIGTILTALTPVIDMLVNEFAVIFEEMAEPITDIVMILGELLKEVIAPMMPAITSLIKLLAQGLILQFRIMITPTKLIITALARFLELLKDTGVITLFGNAIEWLSGALESVFNFVVGLVKGIGDFTKSVGTLFGLLDKNAPAGKPKIVKNGIEPLNKSLNDTNQIIPESTGLIIALDETIEDTGGSADKAVLSLDEMIKKLAELGLAGKSTSEEFKNLSQDVLKLKISSILESDQVAMITNELDALANAYTEYSRITKDGTSVITKSGLEVNKLTNTGEGLRDYNKTLEEYNKSIGQAFEFKQFEPVDYNSLMNASELDKILENLGIKTELFGGIVKNAAEGFMDSNLFTKLFGDSEVHNKLIKSFETFDYSLEGFADSLSKLSDDSGAVFDALGESAYLMAENSQKAFEMLKKAFLKSLLEMVDAQVNTNIAGIYATAISQLGPIAGAIAATAAIISIKALLAKARSEIGAEKGGQITKSYNKPRGATDNILIWLADEEYVIQSQFAKKNKPLLDWINAGRDPIEFIRGKNFDWSSKLMTKSESVKIVEKQATGGGFSKDYHKLITQNEELIKLNRQLLAEATKRPPRYEIIDKSRNTLIQNKITSTNERFHLL